MLEPHSLVLSATWWTISTSTLLSFSLFKILLPSFLFSFLLQLFLQLYHTQVPPLFLLWIAAHPIPSCSMSPLALSAVDSEAKFYKCDISILRGLQTRILSICTT